MRAFFATEMHEQVYLAIAKVGGIHANKMQPGDFIYERLVIEANIIKAAFRSGVQHLMLFGSRCIYQTGAHSRCRIAF
jgi:GDP-L-fucose synthase